VSEKEITPSFGFFVQLYEERDESIIYTGMYFESADLGKEVPRVGDTIIAPLHKADFEPRNPAKHYAFEVVRRYFLPDITGSQHSIVKLLVRQRTLSKAEQALWNVRPIDDPN